MTVEIRNESGVEVDLEALAAVAGYVLEQLRIHPQAELSMLLVDEDAMGRHHLQFMDEPGPTDVMAFPMDELEPGREGEEPPEGLLGDVLLCPAVAARQAADAGHPLAAELELLTVHGVLHLLGYDHAEEDDRAEMFGLQDRLLRRWRAGGSGAPADRQPATAVPPAGPASGGPTPISQPSRSARPAQPARPARPPGPEERDVEL